tara:strand:- start:254 stop:475 length:222 start_codon:yes stop_codon:yes gene_type:complete
MKLLAGVFAVQLCVVDKTTKDTVIAETVYEKNRIEMIELPKLFIPCKIAEGDMFYFVETGGVIEVRCGEPEPS